LQAITTPDPQSPRRYRRHGKHLRESPELLGFLMYNHGRVQEKEGALAQMLKLVMENPSRGQHHT
jgi:hypothetical protein